jgi:hypothetical protein
MKTSQFSINQSLRLKYAIAFFLFITIIVATSAQEYQTVESDTITAQEYQTVESDTINAEKILTNYIDAIGGIDKIKEIKTLQKTLKSKGNVVMNIKGKETITPTESVQEITHLTPSKYLLQSIFGDIRPNYQVMIDDKVYSNFQKKGWTVSNNSGGQELVGTVGSYVPEQSMLIRNLDVVYLGIETIEGTKCYKLRLPDVLQSNEYSDAISSQKYVRHNYYSVETSLLFVSEWENIVIMDYNKKSKTDTESILSNQIIYLDYRPVNGVLFSFKNLTNASNKSPNMESFTELETEMSELLINIEVDETKFDVGN